MSQQDRQRWNQKWRSFHPPSDPHPLLQDWANHLGGAGIALDVACGPGHNSMALARHGYCVLGVDISEVALRRARKLADASNLGAKLLFAQVDLDQWRPPPHSCDLVCVIRFLDRRLIPALREAVKPGGLALYHTRNTGVLRRQPDASPEFLLQPGELHHFFAGWEPLRDWEGEENASILVRKPA